MEYEMESIYGTWFGKWMEWFIMVVTNIGNTASKIIISDHATPASGTYAWYIEAEQIWDMDLLPMDSTSTDESMDISFGFKPFIKKETYRIVRAKITNLTDYQNLKKALASWEAGSTKLYLSVKNEWDTNLAVKGSYATPTTLAQLTGVLGAYAALILVSVVFINIDFIYKNTIIAVGA